MEMCKGVVEKIYAKELDQADKFGNVYRVGLKVNNEWYDFGGKKKPVVQVKVKEDWVAVKEGDYVEFVFEQSGSFRNAKSSQLKIKPESKPEVKQSEVKVFKSKNDAGIKVGHAINCAVALLANSNATINDIEDKAWEILALSRKMGDMYEQWIDSESENSSVQAGSQSNNEKPAAATTKHSTIAGGRSVSATKLLNDDPVF